MVKLDPKDLRMGNYVQDYDGSVCWVSGLGISDVYLSDAQEDWKDEGRAQYMPISEERLVKLGFKKDVRNYTWFEIEHKNSDYKLRIRYTGVKWVWYVAGIQMSVQLEYIHQVQNLFYALMKEDLNGLYEEEAK